MKKPTKQVLSLLAACTTLLSLMSTASLSAGAMGPPPGGGSSSAPTSWAAATEYTADATINGGTFNSTGTSENAIHVYQGASVIFNNITLNRTGTGASGDDPSFYGIGAGFLCTDGTAYIHGGSFSTDAQGGGGIFGYSSGVIYVADAKVRTEQGSSGGIHAAGGGTVYAWDLDVETQGGSSAAIRSDRGGGTMRVDGGSYISNGTGSPAVYCTADIAIHNALLKANGSESVCIEGLNSVRIFDCDLSGNMADIEQNDCTWNIIVYQSMSGDAAVGNSTFNMVGGTLTAHNGGMIYTTNTECHILLSDVAITYAPQNDFFLRCTGNENGRVWGTVGANGSNCTFTANDQDMIGDVIYDSVSTLDFYMVNGSTLKGAFLDDESNAGSGGTGYGKLYISADSTWTVTGNSIISALCSAGKIVDDSGNTVSVVGADGKSYVKGTSAYTVTVGSYSTDDMSAKADKVDSYSTYSVAKPAELGGTAASAGVSFTDVASSEWYYADVMAAVKLGLINGTGSGLYSPDSNMTIAEAIKLAACMNQYHTAGGVTLTNGTTNWYDTYVAYCTEKGIVTKTYADYNTNITRGEFAAIFATALPQTALSAINNIADGAIPDVKLSDSYGAAVYLLYNAGVLTGYDDGSYAPADKIQRKEVAAIVNRMMDSGARKAFTLTVSQPSAPASGSSDIAVPTGEFVVDSSNMTKEEYLATFIAWMQSRGFDKSDPTGFELFSGDVAALGTLDEMIVKVETDSMNMSDFVFEATGS